MDVVLIRQYLFLTALIQIPILIFCAFLEWYRLISVNLDSLFAIPPNFLLIPAIRKNYQTIEKILNFNLLPQEGCLFRRE